MLQMEAHQVTLHKARVSLLGSFPSVLSPPLLLVALPTLYRMKNDYFAFRGHLQ